MKKLNWRRTDWTARNFIFSSGQDSIGQLTFNSLWNFNAEYNDKETRIKFAPKSFWDRNVLITKDGITLGEIHIGLFGQQILKLVSGEKFIIATSFWEQEVYWKTEQGETIITYRQATMSSMEKGWISLMDSLTHETEKLLISSGLFIRQLTRKRIARTVVLILPIIAAASR